MESVAQYRLKAPRNHEEHVAANSQDNRENNGNFNDSFLFSLLNLLLAM
jgi:hypothetical protein